MWHLESKERLVLSQIAPFAILLLLENQQFRCSELFLFCNRQTAVRLMTTQYCINPALQQNMIMDEVEPSLPTALYHYFISEKQNKTSLPTDYGHHFPTYMKIKKQGTLLHTYDTHCTFSHRTCTSFIQIHLGILTALIFCIGLLMLHILMCCEWRRCSGMGDALI